LTASGAFVGGVTGQIRFSSDLGAVVVDVLAGDNLAAVLAKFGATGLVTAIDSGGGVIELTTTSTGTTSEVFFLNADTGVDTALGGFATQVMVAGTWPVFIDIEASAVGEITFGNSFANPMIYNATTGKLTVPGLIDPTGLVYTLFGPINPGVTKGITFVGDGTGGTVLGDFYYRYEGGGLQNISAVVGGSTGLTSVEDEGAAIPGGPFPTLNFVGAGVTATDGGGGTATVTIPGGAGVVVEDEGGAIPGGPHSTLNFTGPGVLASDGGGGVANIAVTSGGGTVQGVQQDVFEAVAFTPGGPGAFVTLTQTYDTTALLVGMVVLYRNGTADMNNVGPAVPTTTKEYRINGTDLQIGADITASLNTYRLVYPRT